MHEHFPNSRLILSLSFSLSLTQQLQDQQSGAGTFQGGGGGGVVGGVVVGQQQPQSRLNQWKLPSLDKGDGDAGGGGTDFSRAPGTTAKSTMSTANASMGSLGLGQGEG